MKLVYPTDFEILEVMANDNGRRNVAPNIAATLNKDRAYLNTRLPELEDYSLLTKVGPASDSGLYEITSKGMLVVEHQDRYHETEDFEEFIENH